MSSLTGGVVSHYRILERLGSGGMGVVYLAEDLRLGRHVALKFLSADLAQTVDSRERLLREARSASALNHPHICTVHEVGEHDGQPFISMEWLEGETLRERLERGPLPVAAALQLGVQVADALEAAHARGLVHRDLKPANLFLTRRGDVKVVDFGLAKSVEGDSNAQTIAGGPALTQPGTAVGTVAYMAPEQARGEPVDARTDLFALGVVLYEGVTGHLPFGGTTTALAFDAVLNREPKAVSELNRDVPAALDGVIRRLLAKSSHSRVQSARELREQLEIIRASVVRRASDASGTRAVPSVAVLPFANISADPENEYFSDGITEEIISALSALRGLRVAARTSSFAFKGRTADLAEVGAKLNVATVLTGSVRKAGSRLRITVELVSIAEGFQLWSQRYDRQAEDIFAIQDEIAEAIASRLKVSLEAQPEEAARPRTEKIDAYQAYLKGRFAINQRGRGLLEALELFDSSLALDPDYPLALTGQGDAYALLSFYGYLPAHEAMSKARAAALRALDQAPGLADAHATLLFISCMYDWDWHSVRRQFERAMAANRHCVPALQWYSLYLALITGEMDEALSTARRALDVDPLSAYSHIALNLAFIGAGRYEEAEAAARTALDLAPDAWIALRNLGITLNLAGRNDEALAALERGMAVSNRHPWMISTYALGLSLAGRHEAAAAAHAELLEASAHTFVQPMFISISYAAVGDFDIAMDWLERSYRERDPIVVMNYWAQSARGFREHPRFAAVMARTGVPLAPDLRR
jgi:serine/threonine protein kinase/tetratricopeptide (TPR) repeat protein